MANRSGKYLKWSPLDFIILWITCMAIQIYANGISVSKDKYVSVYSWFLQYDTKLNWPFVGSHINTIESAGR